MSCAYQDQTLLWLYGEADDSHLAHLATCGHCQALVAEHEQVLGALAEARPVPVQRRWTPWVVSGIALAAAVAMSLLVNQPSDFDPVERAELTAHADLDLDLDLQLDELERALSSLEADLEYL